MRRTKKVIASVSAVFLTSTVVGCGTNSNTSEIISTDEVTTSAIQEPSKETQKPAVQQPVTQPSTEIQTDDDVEAFAKSNGIGLPEVPNDDYCNEWEFDLDAGVWRCSDSESSHYSYLYYGGLYYATLSYLKNNKAYNDYQSSKGFAGGNKLQSKFSNGINRSGNNSTNFNNSNGSNTGKAGFGSGSSNISGG